MGSVPDFPPSPGEGGVREIFDLMLIVFIGWAVWHDGYTRGREDGRQAARDWRR